MAPAVDSTRSTAPAAAITRFFPGTLRARHDGRQHYGQSLSGAALAAEFLKLAGADVVFGIPGGASLPLCDALTNGHLEGAFRFVLTGHEQGAGFEAEGYAAAAGRCGFCTATSGPGATNLVTPLADATRDSRPVFALVGNTATSAEPEAFQAIDIVGISNGRATKLSLRPERAEQVQEMLVRAYHAAVTGRPGAVLVDLPKDVQVGRTPMLPWEGLIARFDWTAPLADPGAVQALAELLATAERPLIYAGHGVLLSGAAGALRELSARFNVPVATTVHALGTLRADDPLNLGMLGMHGTMVANLAPYLADLVVALGARFDDRVVGAAPPAFAPHARLAHVDVDAYQLNRVRRVDLAIVGDAREVTEQLSTLLVAMGHADRAPWLAALAAIREAMPTQSYDCAERETLTHEHVYAKAAEICAAAVRPTVATFDVGIHQMKGASWFPAQEPRSWITSGGMGSMGCSLPMAVGAHFARPEATVLAFCGDGGFVMSSHELDTIGGYNLPIKIIVFDDSSLGMVGKWHGLYFGGRDLTSDRRRGRVCSEPDLECLKKRLHEDLDRAQSADDLAAVLCEHTAALAGSEWPLFAASAAAYGIPAERVHSKEQLPGALQRALHTPGPYLLQVIMPAEKGVYPLMEPGTTPQQIIWKETEPGSGKRVPAGERFDYQLRSLRPHDQ